LESQCDVCKNKIPDNAYHCMAFQNDEQIPDEVIKCQKECSGFEHVNMLKIMSQNKNEDRLFGGIFGLCVGDALGVPLEFYPRAERKRDPVREMRAYGRYNKPFGTWSDDSSLTFCLMDSLKDGYDPQDIANKFCQYFFDELWTPNGSVFDIGTTTLQAIGRIKAGNDPLKCGGRSKNDNGNGSLMRILPLAFYLRDEQPARKNKIIAEVSSITHQHKRSKLACIIYVELAVNLLRGAGKEESMENTREYIKKYCGKEYKRELPYFKRILEDDISKLSEDEISSSGYVVDTLEASLWSFLTTGSYSESIFKAINLGGDTDTAAAIAGGLSGIFYGIRAIPDNWIQCIARKKDIYGLTLRFTKCTPII